MSEFVLSCSGPVTVDVTHVPACADGWVLTQIDPFDVSQIDPVQVAGFVGSGFFILLPLWAAVIGGKTLYQSIK